MSEMPPPLTRSNMKFGSESGPWQPMYVLIGSEVLMMETQILNSNAKEFLAQNLTFLQKMQQILIELLTCLVHMVQERLKM
jgi:hypothetical protein